jgi:hypothetical protein
MSATRPIVPWLELLRTGAHTPVRGPDAEAPRSLHLGVGVPVRVLEGIADVFGQAYTTISPATANGRWRLRDSAALPPGTGKGAAYIPPTIPNAIRLGEVEAADQREAIEKAAEKFQQDPAALIVTHRDERVLNSEPREVSFCAPWQNGPPPARPLSGVNPPQRRLARHGRA